MEIKGDAFNKSPGRGATEPRARFSSGCPVFRDMKCTKRREAKGRGFLQITFAKITFKCW